MKLEQLVRPNIQKLQAYSSARDEFSGTEGVFLDANENPYGEWNRYPDPYQQELKTKLSALKQVDVSNIFIGNGSDEVIDLAFRIFCEPGKDTALTFSPSYGMYDVSAAINDVELIKVPLDADFQMDKAKLSPFLKQENLKLIFICSPNNPTGNVIRAVDIVFLLEQFQGIVIIDEAYIDFAEKDSWISNIQKYDRLIVSQTFSKSWALAAARVGVAYANPNIIQLLNKVKPPYNISALNQAAAIKALDNHSAFQLHLKNILKEKERLKKVLEDIDVVEKIYPSEANFFLIKVNNANRLYQKLVAEKVIIRNRHKLVDNCLRISVGTKAENDRLIQVIKEQLSVS